MLEKIIKVPIYNVKIKIVICENFEEYCKKNDISEEKLDYRAVVFDFTKFDRDFHYIVLFQPKVNINTIVHEVFHLTVGVMNYVGNILSDSSEESFAYLNEYLFKIIYNIVIIKNARNTTK